MILNSLWMQTGPLLRDYSSISTIGDLGPGETEVSQLARQREDDVRLLLDNQKVCKVARIVRLQTVGGVGLLLGTKINGYSYQVRPLIYDLRRGGLFLSTGLLEEVLSLAGEQ